MAFSLKGGGVLYEPTFPALETSNTREQFVTDSLKGEEDLTGELFRSTLAFSLEGGGVLDEPTFPALETSNAREQFVTALYKKLRIYFNRNLLGDLIKKPL